MPAVLFHLLVIIRSDRVFPYFHFCRWSTSFFRISLPSVGIASARVLIRVRVDGRDDSDHLVEPNCGRSDSETGNLRPEILLRKHP